MTTPHGRLHVGPIDTATTGEGWTEIGVTDDPNVTVHPTDGDEVMLLDKPPNAEATFSFRTTLEAGTAVEPRQRLVTFLPLPSGAPDGWDWRHADLTHYIGRPASLRINGIDQFPVAYYRLTELRPVDGGQRLMVVAER